MTKKDYELLAAALVASKPSGSLLNDDRALIRRDQWRASVDEIADALQTDNGRFNRERFLTACGV